MASAGNEGLLPSAQLFPTGKICFLPLLRKESASGKPGVLVEGCVSRKQHQHRNRATQTPSAASVDQPTVPTVTVRLKGKRLVKGVRLTDDAGTATGIHVLAAEAPRANSCPWEGLRDPSHTKGTLCGVTLGLPGGKVSDAAPDGGQPAPLFWAIWQGLHCTRGHGQEEATAVPFHRC